MTDNEIKKALECCASGDDGCGKGCPFHLVCTSPIKTMENLIKLALDLINRLQADVENYKQIAEHQQSVTMDRGFEIKRLKDEKSKLENKIDEIYPLVMQLPNAMQQAKAEAYKEFAERLKAVYEGFDDKNEVILYSNLLTAIDCLLIGMVGE